MSNVLGSLFVELGINTAAFVDGLSKATYAAKAGVQQMGSAFASIGNQISALGANFGQFGSIVGASLATVGTNVTNMARHMGDLSGAAGALKIGGIGFIALAAGAVTAATAVIGIAEHASESAKRLYDLSQATGVSVSELSGLGIIAKLDGVDIETLAKGLERLSKTAFQAAVAPNAATNAYRTLGINVKDTQGNLKSTTEIFTEVADKFSKMEDGATKTALAMNIFGRAGANLIPVLNQGGEAAKYWIEFGTKVGAVLTEKAAAGADAFRERLDQLGIIATGVQNKLMIALLPAMNNIVESIVAFLETGNRIGEFGDMVGKTLIWIAERVYDTIYAFDWWKAVVEKNTADIARGIKNVGYAYDWWKSKITGEPPPEIYARLDTSEIDKQFQRSADQIALSRAALESKTIMLPSGVTAPRKGAAPAPAPPEAGVKAEKDLVADLIMKTEIATAAEVARASAVGQTNAALMLQKATSDAIQKVEEVRLSITDRLASLAVDEANEVKKGATAKVTAIQAQEAALRGQLSVLDESKQKLIALFDTKEVAAYTVTVSTALQKQNEEMQEQLVSQRQLAAAQQVGGSAVVAATMEEKLAKDRAQVASLNEAYRLLSETQGVDKTQLDSLAISIGKASAEVQKHRELLQQEHDVTVLLNEAKYNLAARYKDDITNLDEVMAVAKKNNDVIAQTLILADQQKSGENIAKQWDTAALKVGNFSDKFRATMNELTLASKNVEEQMFGAFKKGFEGISTNLADMVATGKANFKSLFETLESEILRILFSKALTALLTKLVSFIPGLGGPGGIGAIFGGGKAEGGPVAPGVEYLVGEKGPERFIPGSSGTIVPSSSNSNRAPTMNASIVMHVHGATDPDTFRKASPQVAAEIYRQMTAAHAHNGGGF
jgi:lambda family phage tail tape measure protein